MRTLIKLAIAGLIVHAAFRAGTSYMTYYTFRDELQQIAQFSGGLSERQVLARTVEIARQLDVPVSPEQIGVRKANDRTFINTSYRADIEVFPSYFYPWQYSVDVEAWTYTIPEVRDNR